MSEALLSIGGLDVRLSGDDSVDTAMDIPGMKTFICPAIASPLDIRLDTKVQIPHCRLLHQFSIVDGQKQCRFGVDAQEVFYYEFEHEGWVRYNPRQPLVVELTTIRNIPVLRFALWTAYSIAGLHLGSVPVHSSVAVCNGKAVMCLGESGTGKSTHTRLWIDKIPGTYLLNDDSPIVRFDGHEARVYGSPWSGKTDCFIAEDYPIAAFLRLEQRKENTIRRLGVVESFAALQPSCPPALAHEERCMDLLVDFISKVIGCVPVYRMGCLPDADAALLSHNTIMG